MSRGAVTCWFYTSFSHTLRFTQALLTASLSGLIYSTHIFLLSLLYVLSFLWLCLLEASRCPRLLVRGATGGYRRSGARALQLLRCSLGYRCAQGQSPTGRLGLRRKQDWGGHVCSFREKQIDWVSHFAEKMCLLVLFLTHEYFWTLH